MKKSKKKNGKAKKGGFDRAEYMKEYNRKKRLEAKAGKKKTRGKMKRTKKAA